MATGQDVRPCRGKSAGECLQAHSGSCTHLRLVTFEKPGERRLKRAAVLDKVLHGKVEGVTPLTNGSLGADPHHYLQAIVCSGDKARRWIHRSSQGKVGEDAFSSNVALPRTQEKGVLGVEKRHAEAVRHGNLTGRKGQGRGHETRTGT